MMQRMLTLFLTLGLLITMLTTPVSAASSSDLLKSVDYMYGNPDTGLLYGPPLAAFSGITREKAKQSVPVSRSGAKNLLKDVLRYVPDTLTYQVKSGDSLYEIAQTFHTKIDTLVAMNNIANPSLLNVGQRLQVPNQEKTQINTGLMIDRVINATLTAYTAGPESTGKYPGHPGYGVTASGRYVQENHTIAVDPRMIPLGTKVYIEGLGVRVADDTGGAIQGNRIDVYMSDLNAAIHFGVKRNVKVYILKDGKEISA
ncbi:MAG TPA: 3D domain-containing protein [Bacilli bacterium]|nr:3D domain-containing protein [Bacilli bacterium]